MKYERRIAALQSVLQNEGDMRTQFSTELLDEVGSLLSVINYNLSVIQENNEVDQEEMNRVHRLIDAAICETRKLSHAIMPHTLMHLGLSVALMELFELIRAGGIRVTAHINHFSSAANGYEANILYRLFESMLRFLSSNRRCSEIVIECEQLLEKTIFYLRANGQVVYDHDFEKELNLIRSYSSILQGTIYYEWYGEERAKIILTVPTDIV